jgi:hypothetical protein
MRFYGSDRGRAILWVTLVLVLLSLAGSVKLELSVVGAAKMSSTEPPVPTVSGTEIRRENWVLKPAGLDISQWPVTVLNFSIERLDRGLFSGLSIEAITARVDDQLIGLDENSLQRSSNNSSGVLLLIDSSGSMEQGDSGITKLEAAKSATLGMIDRLPLQTTIGIMSFSNETRLIEAPTINRERLRRAISNFGTNSGGTRLYDAIDGAIAYASSQGLSNILILSDGYNYRPGSGSISRSDRDQFKRDREESIVRESKRQNIRLFTVAIGDRRPDPENRLYVDVTTLNNVTLGGGFGGYIDLPALQSAAQDDTGKYRQLLLNELQTLLDRIGESFRFDYSLRIPVGAVIHKGTNGKILYLTFRAGDQIMPLEITLDWKEGLMRPDSATMRVLEPVLIPLPRSGTGAAQLIRIYLILSGLLLTLTGFPLVGTRMKRFLVKRQRHRSVMNLAANSVHIGGSCPNEEGREWGRHRFRVGDEVVICPSCGLAHHLGCWNDNGDRCWSRNCGYEMETEQ